MPWDREFTERVAGDMADWGGQEFMERRVEHVTAVFTGRTLDRGNIFLDDA